MNNFERVNEFVSSIEIKLKSFNESFKGGKMKRRAAIVAITANPADKKIRDEYFTVSNSTIFEECFSTSY